jgi:hypothetical protein
MTSLSDTLTVGLVLVLLFGSIALYLYTRIQQAEQKISLLESILLDLKMSAEVKSYTELPAMTSQTKENEATEIEESYIPYDDNDDDGGVRQSDNDEVYPGAVVGSSGSSTPTVSSRNDDANDNEINQYKSVVAEAINEDVEIIPSASKVSANYEAMTLKELQTLAKSRGITGAGSMKKGAIIEALKTSDRSSTNTIEPGSQSSFLDTSSPFQGSEAIAESE